MLRGGKTDSVKRRDQKKRGKRGCLKTRVLTEKNMLTLGKKKSFNCRSVATHPQYKKMTGG